MKMSYFTDVFPQIHTGTLEIPITAFTIRFVQRPHIGPCWEDIYTAATNYTEDFYPNRLWNQLGGLIQTERSVLALGLNLFLIKQLI